jgi:hypothetical protein
MRFYLWPLQDTPKETDCLHALNSSSARKTSKYSTPTPSQKKKRKTTYWWRSSIEIRAASLIGWIREDAFHSTKTSGLNSRKFTVPNGRAFSGIPEKRTTLQDIPKFSKISYREFDFTPAISGIFVWMVRIWKIQQFSDFKETLPGNFRPTCPVSTGFGIFGRMENAPSNNQTKTIDGCRVWQTSTTTNL